MTGLLFFFVFSLPQPLLDLQKHFKSANGFEVSFEQHVDQTLFKDQKEKASGKIHFKRPDKLLWIYESPEKKAMTYQKRQLIVEEDGHVEKLEISGPLTLEQSFSFLWGQPDLTQFSIEPIDKNKFRIKPKKLKDAPFKSIEIDVERGLVKEALIKTSIDGSNRLSFSNWVLK